MIRADYIVKVLLGEDEYEDMLPELGRVATGEPWIAAQSAMYHSKTWASVFHALGYDGPMWAKIALVFENASDALGEFDKEFYQDSVNTTWQNLFTMLTTMKVPAQHIEALKRLWYRRAKLHEDQADPELLKDVAAYGMNPPWNVARDAWEAAERYASGNPWKRVLAALGYHGPEASEVATDILDSMNASINRAENGEIDFAGAVKEHAETWSVVVEPLIRQLAMKPEDVMAMHKLWAYLSPEMTA